MDVKYFINVADEIERGLTTDTARPKRKSFFELKQLEYLARIFAQDEASIDLKVMFDIFEGDTPCRKAFFKEMRELADKTFPNNPLLEPRLRLPLKRRHRRIKAMFPKEEWWDIHCFLKSHEELEPSLRLCIQKYAKKRCLKALRKDLPPEDAALLRTQKLKQALRLSDKDVEILLFFYLTSQNPLFRRIFHCGEPSQPLVFFCAVATGIPSDQVLQAFSPNSVLRKLMVLIPSERYCEDPHDYQVSEDIALHLSGTGTNDSLNGFHLSTKSKVSFEQLQGENPEARIALSLIQSHDGQRPLNILFYGKEGTGKTELSRAIAAKLRRPLWEVNLKMEKSESRFSDFWSPDDCALHKRLRSLMLADWQSQRTKGIILMDEADLVLNYAEKGMLNSLFDSIHSPVIWISNRIGQTIEASTLRRFDYSMKFDSLNSKERESVLLSVLKENRAGNLFSAEEKRQIAERYPVNAGVMTLAVQNIKNLLKATPNLFPSNPQQDSSAAQMMGMFLTANMNLTGIHCESAKEKESHAPNYSLEGLNTDYPTEELLDAARGFNKTWKTLDIHSKPDSLNILLYGAPGTGKTEFARHLARALGRELIFKRASDWLDCFIGMTEKKIRETFREADKTKSILFLDEADSFLTDRSGAVRNWEVTLVNELLTQMENFHGIFIAATNFNEILDKAAARRFAFKVKFNFLTPEGIDSIWKSFFPDFECPESAKRLPSLAPGDFNAVNGRLRFLPKSALTAERLAAELEKEVEAKDFHGNRKMGF